MKRHQSQFFNMRRFHNFIKRHLLEQYSKPTNLLDLACGKGGDISKWNDNNIKIIHGYDINNDSIIVANKRNNNINYKFYTKDLSKDPIKTNLKFDTITCFFAFHYFFESSFSLNNFVKNLELINPNGYFLITLLCSDELDKINYTFNSENLSITPVNTDSHELFGRSINVFIKDSVLDIPTTEYISNKNFIINYMNLHGFNLIETQLFNHYYRLWTGISNKNHLSDTEKAFSFLNRTFIFQKK